MADWVSCDCGVINNADNYNKAMKEWSSKPHMMYASLPPRYVVPPPKFICEACGAEI